MNQIIFFLPLISLILSQEFITIENNNDIFLYDINNLNYSKKLEIPALKNELKQNPIKILFIQDYLILLNIIKSHAICTVININNNNIKKFLIKSKEKDIFSINFNNRNELVLLSNTSYIIDNDFYCNIINNTKKTYEIKSRLLKFDNHPFELIKNKIVKTVKNIFYNSSNDIIRQHLNKKFSNNIYFTKNNIGNICIKDNDISSLYKCTNLSLFYNNISNIQGNVNSFNFINKNDHNKLIKCYFDYIINNISCYNTNYKIKNITNYITFNYDSTIIYSNNNSLYFYGENIILTNTFIIKNVTIDYLIKRGYDYCDININITQSNEKKSNSIHKSNIYFIVIPIVLFFLIVILVLLLLNKYNGISYSRLLF